MWLLPRLQSWAMGRLPWVHVVPCIIIHSCVVILIIVAGVLPAAAPFPLAGPSHRACRTGIPHPPDWFHRDSVLVGFAGEAPSAPLGSAGLCRVRPTGGEKAVRDSSRMSKIRGVVAVPPVCIARGSASRASAGMPAAVSTALIVALCARCSRTLRRHLVDDLDVSRQRAAVVRREVCRLCRREEPVLTCTSSGHRPQFAVAAVPGGAREARRVRDLQRGSLQRG